MAGRHDLSNLGASKGSVLLASRAELFRILSFLDTNLPESCPAHLFTQAAITSGNPSYSVYYTKDRDNSYGAIVCLKNNHLKDSRLDSTNCWMVTGWDGSSAEEICRISDVVPIDWNHDAVFTFLPSDQTKAHFVTKYISNHHVEFIPDEGSPCSQYFLPSTDALNATIEIPDGVYITSLQEKHAAFIHQNWPYNSTATVEDVIEDILDFPSVGVFLKETNQLVTWMMCHPPVGMSRLCTLEPFRRQGYARLAIKYLSKLIAQSGSVPFVSIIKGNTPAVALFESMGFKFLCHRDILLVPAPVNVNSQGCTTVSDS